MSQYNIWSVSFLVIVVFGLVIIGLIEFVIIKDKSQQIGAVKIKGY